MMSTPLDRHELDVTPSKAHFDFPDHSHGHAIGSGQMANSSSIGESFAYRKNLFLVQECIMVLASSLQFFWLRAGRVVVASRKSFWMKARSVAVSSRGVVSALRDTIEPVIKMSAEPQMGRIAADSIVASMQYQRSTSAWATTRQRDAMVQLIRYTVRFCEFAVPPEMPVTTSIAAQFPWPAFCRSFDRDVSPEVFWCVSIPSGARHG